MVLHKTENEDAWNTVKNDSKLTRIHSFYIVTFELVYLEQIHWKYFAFIEYLSQFITSGVDEEIADANASVQVFSFTASEQLAKLTKGNPKI